MPGTLHQPFHFEAEDSQELLPDEMLAQAGRQDKRAFEELVRRHQNRVYTLAYRMTGDEAEAHDLTQEAFLRCYAALPQFNPELRFASWLYRIATNLCINFLKSGRGRRPAAEVVPSDLDEAGGAPESLYEAKERRQRVQQAILSLPAKYRLVILLRHMQDKSYEEIAEILEMPVNTVRTHLFRAREILRRQLETVDR